MGAHSFGQEMALKKPLCWWQQGEKKTDKEIDDNQVAIWK